MIELNSDSPLLLKYAPADIDNQLGEFSGIAATFDIDRQGERFDPSAFDATIKAWKSRGAYPPLLWHHIQTEPIGVITDVQVSGRGIHITGKLALGTTNGKRAYELLKLGSGALALSVGGYAINRDGDTITEFDWLELSLTPTPAQAGAIVHSVKSVLFDSRKSFERQMRNVFGLSANEAKRLAAGGYAALTSDATPEPDTAKDCEVETQKQLTTMAEMLSQITRAMTR